MTRTFVFVALAASTLTVAVACSGDDPPVSTPAGDGGASSTSSSSSSSGDVEDAGPVDRYEEREDGGSGVTFADLYRDFFGPTGQASCAGDGLCHGGPDKAGALGSSGYVCGSDKDACYAAMTGTPGLVTSQDTTDPTKSTLYLVARHRRPDGTLAGSMPKRPVRYVFSTASMERIATWIKNGAKND